MNHKPNLKLLSFATIAVIVFLFAFSPALLFTSATNARVLLTSPFGNVKSAPVIIPASHNVHCTANCTFVTNVGDGYVQVLSKSGKLVGAINTGGSSNYGATYAPVTKLVYVFDYSDGKIFAISPATLTVVHSYSLGGAIFGVYVPSNKMVYITQFGYGTVTPFNPLKGTFGSAISVCTSSPEYIAYNAGDGNVYVPARASCYSVINPSTNTATSVSLGSEPLGVACDSSAKLGKYCWITDGGNWNVYKVSGSTVYATITGAANAPWGVAFNPKSDSFYVTSYGNNAVVVIKGSTYTSISLSNGPDADCLGPAHVIVVPLFGGGSSGYASGINSSNTILWTTYLGSTSYYPESCSIS